MISHEIETYRGFRVRLILEETPTHWMCEVTFERTDSLGRHDVPTGFGKDADKSNVSALNFSIAMQSEARTLIDWWFANRIGLKCPSP